MHKKHLKFYGLYTRDRLRFIGSKKPVVNIFHASVQKTGSQWIKAIFEDKRLQNRTKLTVYPQHRYEWDEFKKEFPRYTFVPGLYMSYQSYEEILKPKNGKYKTIYVARDPRDIIVSWYYSMKYSHGVMGKVSKHRAILKNLDLNEGISYCIKNFHLKLSFMKDWYLNCTDINTIFLKFEDLTSNPVESFKQIFDRCSIEISNEELENILGTYSKKNMRNRQNDEDREVSHYRKDGKTWRELFTNEHHQLFKKINGDILNVLEYEDY